MSDTYTKLFSSITESTVWGEPYPTRIVWVTMLAMADARGNVYGAVPGLARRANVTLQEVEAALAAFLAPDPYSRTQADDGRRIEAIDGGWRLINHGKYAAVRNGDERKQYQRQWDRDHRGGRPNNAKRTPDNPRQPPTKSDDPDPTSTNTSTNTKAEKQEQEHAPPPAAPLVPAKPAKRSRRKPETFPLPEDFAISDRVRKWAEAKGHHSLQAHFDNFVGKAKAKGYVYADWDEALMSAIRDNWANVGAPNARAGPAPSYGKTAQAISTLEDMKRGLAQKRTADGIPEAPLLELGTHAGR